MNRLPALLAVPCRYPGAAHVSADTGEVLALVYAHEGGATAVQRARALCASANFIYDQGEDLEDVLRVLLETRRLPLKLRRRLEGIEAGLRTALLAVVPEETRGDARAGRVR